MIADNRKREEGFVLELRDGLSPDEADRRVAMAHRAGDVGARGLSFYLADMCDRGAHQALGFHGIEQYAETRYHIRPATTREYVRVGRALRDLPLLDQALGEGTLFWSVARSLAEVATPATEAGWVQWARGRTAREIAAQVRLRDKGELPTDPARRRIRSIYFTVQARLGALEYERWSTARAKLEAEMGRPVSDAEMMNEAAQLLLSTRADDTVPGRAPVNDSHYTVSILHEGKGGAVSVETEGGPVALDAGEAREVLEAAGRPDLAADLPDDEDENAGPEVPPEDRDIPTPPWMLRQVLSRDRYRCLNPDCRGRKNLTGHHKLYRRNGGPTQPDNLVTECEGCHSLTHDGYMIVRGRIPDGLRFLDKAGRPLRELTEAAREAVSRIKVDARASSAPAEPVAFDAGLPETVDAAWWRHNGHLFTRITRQGCLDLIDGAATGVPMPADRSGRVPDRDARASRSGGFSSLVGQERAVAGLLRAVAAARQRRRPVPHTLLCGPPGLGKTSLALAVAGEMDATLHVVSAPTIEHPDDLLGYLVALREGDVLFVDEIHRLPLRVAEALHEAMDFGRLSLPVRMGNVRRTMHVQLAGFTLIGATTEEDLVPSPLRQRFTGREHIEFYGRGDLAKIVRREAWREGIPIAADAAWLLAGASRETPRVALGLLRCVADEAIVRHRATIDRTLVAHVLETKGIDRDGMGPIERRYLAILRDVRRPLSLGTLADRLGLSKQALLTVHEPYLVRRGLILRTCRGRVLAA